MAASKHSRVAHPRRPRDTFDGLHRANWTCDLQLFPVRHPVPSGYLRPSYSGMHVTSATATSHGLAGGWNCQFSLVSVVLFVASHTR
jgi:hypothetical protein